MNATESGLDIGMIEKTAKLDNPNLVYSSAVKDALITTSKIIKPEKSKGQIFKENYGISKTFKRNMQKHGFNYNSQKSINEFRLFKQANKKNNF